MKQHNFENCEVCQYGLDPVMMMYTRTYRKIYEAMGRSFHSTSGCKAKRSKYKGKKFCPSCEQNARIALKCIAGEIELRVWKAAGLKPDPVLFDSFDRRDNEQDDRWLERFVFVAPCLNEKKKK